MLWTKEYRRTPIDPQLFGVTLYQLLTGTDRADSCRAVAHRRGMNGHRTRMNDGYRVVE